MNVVTKLSVRSLWSHRGRSAVIGTAIILTLVLFMTVISIAFDIFTSSQLSLMLATGSDLHSVVYSSGMTLTEDELLEKIQAFPKVKDAYLLTENMNQLKTGGADAFVRVCSVSGRGMLPHLFSKLTKGEFPETADEIALNVLDFPDAKPGDRVEMTISGYPVKNADGSLEISSDGGMVTESRTFSYTVSGLFESEADRPAQVAGMVLLDRDRLPETQMSSVMISYKNTLNMIGKHNALVESLGEYTTATGEVRANINNAYLSAGEGMFTPANVMLVVFAVSVIFFCAFFLIYNIYSISLTQDMQAYGLLSVVGTTYRQIRAIIRRQALILYALFAPVGLALGYALGWCLIAPIFMSMSGKNMNYRFSGWILLVSAALTLFTLLFSAMRPVCRIRKLSPIETVNGSAVIAPKPVQRTKKITPAVLAARFSARNPRRTAVTALSTVFSILIFIFISSAVGLVKYIGMDEMTIHDVQLFTYGERQVMRAGSNVVSTQETKLTLSADSSMIDAALLEKVRTVENLEAALPIYFAEAVVDAPMRAQDAAKELLPLMDPESKILPVDRMEEIANGEMRAIFLSIPDVWLGELRIAEGEKYKGGELAAGTHVLSLAGTNNITIQTEKGYQTVFFDETFETGDTVRSANLQSGYTAIVPDFDRSYKALYHLLGYVSWGNCVQLFVMPESVFLREFEEYGIYAILCDCADETGKEQMTLTDSQREFRKRIDEIVSPYRKEERGGQHYVRSAGRFDGLEELQNRLLAISLTGYSLCAIIFLIGMMNTVNSALSSVIERRRECAMLEAVGMTDRQMMRMMLLENFRVAGLAGCITAFVGIPLVTVILRSAMGAAVPISWQAGLLMLAVCIAVSMLSGLAAYQLTKAAPVVERIKVE